MNIAITTTNKQKKKEAINPLPLQERIDF